jgi:hypothetical protein
LEEKGTRGQEMNHGDSQKRPKLPLRPANFRADCIIRLTREKDKGDTPGNDKRIGSV